MSTALLDPLAAIAPITDQEFARFQALIRAEAGIALSDTKRALLVGRLTPRLRALGLRSFGEYYRHVQVAGQAERVQMLNCVCTNETQFFREPRHFQHLEESLFPALQAAAEAGARPRRLRLWSAACSTGEEAYSLAMTALRFFPPGSGWDVEVLATDLSTRVLERARAATWPVERAATIPTALLKAFMLRGTRSQEGLMRAAPELRARVRVERLNLNDAAYTVIGRFDAIFCRNVLIYFDAGAKTAVVHRLLAHLEPGGRFFVGHAESLAAATPRLRSVAAGAYVLAEARPSAPQPGGPAPDARAGVARW